MLPSGRRCVARLVRLPLSCYLGLLLTSSAVLFLPATSWALLPTSSAAGPLQTPLTQSTPSPSTLGLTAFAPPSSQPGPNLTALQALEQAKLTGFDAAGGGWFGFSVAAAMSGWHMSTLGRGRAGRSRLS